MKVVWLFVVLLVVSSSVGIAIRSYQEAENARTSFNTEMYKRISVEEDLQSAKDKIRALEQQLSSEKKNSQALSVRLTESQQERKNLQMRLDKAAQLKNTLETKIKELEVLTSALQ